MSTIGIITPYAFPETGAASMRVHAFATALRQNGFTPIVFALQKGLPQNAQTEYSVVRFSKRRDLGKLFAQYDVKLVIASTPPADLGMASLFFCKWLGIPLFADIRDPWVFDKHAVGLIQTNTLKYFIQKEIEKWFYVLADERFVVTRQTAQLFEKGLHIPASAFTLIPNGVQTEFFNSEKSNGSMRKMIRTKLAIPSKSPVFIFLGSVWRDIPELIRRIKPILMEKNAHLLIVGNADNQSSNTALKKIHDTIENESLAKQVHLCLNIPADQIPPYLHASDAGINILAAALHYSTPVKTYEYAYASLPVLSFGPPQGALADLHASLSAGFYCLTWEEFSEKALAIIQHISTQKKKAAHDSKWVGENFSRTKWSNEVVKRVRSHLSVPPAHNH